MTGSARRAPAAGLRSLRSLRPPAGAEEHNPGLNAEEHPAEGRSGRGHHSGADREVAFQTPCDPTKVCNFKLTKVSSFKLTLTSSLRDARRKPCPHSEARTQVRAFVYLGAGLIYIAYLDEFGHVGPTPPAAIPGTTTWPMSHAGGRALGGRGGAAVSVVSNPSVRSRRAS